MRAILDIIHCFIPRHWVPLFREVSFAIPDIPDYIRTPPPKKRDMSKFLNDFVNTDRVKRMATGDEISKAVDSGDVTLDRLYSRIGIETRPTPDHEHTTDLAPKKVKSEARIQQDCVMWFKNTYPDLAILLFHIPNGEKRGKATAMKLKGMGVTKGVPDIFFAYTGTFRKGLFIEMKTDKGRASKYQIEFAAKVERQGYQVIYCSSKEAFKAVIIDHMSDATFI